MCSGVVVLHPTSVKVDLRHAAKVFVVDFGLCSTVHDRGFQLLCAKAEHAFFGMRDTQSFVEFDFIAQLQLDIAQSKDWIRNYSVCQIA